MKVILRDRRNIRWCWMVSLVALRNVNAFHVSYVTRVNRECFFHGRRSIWWGGVEGGWRVLLRAM